MASFVLPDKEKRLIPTLNSYNFETEFSFKQPTNSNVFASYKKDLKVSKESVSSNDKTSKNSKDKALKKELMKKAKSKSFQIKTKSINLQRNNKHHNCKENYGLDI